jgi:hypothetical protein
LQIQLEMAMKHRLTPEDRQKAGSTNIRRYGADFIAERARRGLLKGEIAGMRHPERLTPDQITAMLKQALIRQAALMRYAKAAKRAARAARAATAPQETL